MQENTVNSYLEAIPMPALLIGPDARIIGANAKVVKLNPHAAKSRPFILVFRQPNLSSAIETCLATQQPQMAEYFHDDEGHDIRYDVTCSYVEGQGQTGVLLCFQDVTQQEQVGHIHRDFVANVSHELRTPLTALMGFVETLRGPARDDPAAQERFLGFMESEAGRMNRLVGDLLSLSRVESEAWVRPGAQVDIVGVLSTAMRNLHGMAEERNVEFVSEVPDETVTLTADSDQMIQLFTNLLENGIKYGGKGGRVTVRLTELDRDSSLRKPAIKIEVSDTGPGIQAVHIPRLTERFYRVDQHRSRAMGGTGLGLAIVKHIINRHRGRLKIESEIGVGTTFKVLLPKG